MVGDKSNSTMAARLVRNCTPIFMSWAIEIRTILFRLYLSLSMHFIKYHFYVCFSILKFYPVMPPAGLLQNSGKIPHGLNANGFWRGISLGASRRRYTGDAYVE